MTRLAFCASIAAAALACGDSPTEPRTPGLRVVARPAATDTIEATPVQAIVVEVRGDDGAPLTGAVVRFESGLNQAGHATMLVSHPAAPQFDLLSVDTVDARGRAAALVRFWSLAGPGSVVIKVPVRGLTDTVAFTVAAGALAGVNIRQQDTAVVSGSTLALRGSTFDRGGNPRPEPIGYTLAATPNGIATVGANGDFAAIGALGTAVVYGTAAGKRDSVVVTVFPRGRVVRSVFGAGPIVLADLDGGNPQTLLDFPASLGGFSWSPDASLLAFHAEDGVRILGPDGRLRRLFEQQPTEINNGGFYPAFAPGSTKIYFSATAAGDIGPGIWRSNIDGTGLEQVTTGPHDAFPTASPDGRFLAYWASEPGGGQLIRTFDLLTRTKTQVAVPGIVPRWSPRGDLIAYNDLSTSSFNVMRPDGSARRRLAEAPPTDTPMSWSPSGEFLLAVQPFSMTVIEVASGRLVTFNTSIWSFHAAWRPEPAAAPGR